MQSIIIKTLQGNSTEIELSKIELLKTSMRGKVLMTGDEAYEEARSVWNGMINRRPAVILQCAGASDVIKAVRFVGENNLLTSVKCGGHNFAGLSVCEGGVMIDLSKMRSIRVDPKSRTARAEGGALLSDLDKEVQSFGLATTSGTVSHTGIAGLTLGGGQGWLMNKFGLSCDNLISVDIVTADGELRTASKEQNPDLFWAVRGGGGNFGIVTSFEYQLHPVGPVILGGLIVYPIDQAKKVLRFFRDYSMNTPDEFSLLAGMLCLPDGTPAIALAAAWLGDKQEGEQVLQPLRELCTPIADMLGEIPYLQLQSIFDAAVPHGMPRYLKMGYMPYLNDEFIDIVITHWSQRKSPYSVILFNTIKGAVTRVHAEETAFFHRGQQWHYDFIAQWTDPGQEQENISWAHSLWNDTVRFTKGASINFLGADDGQDRVKLSFGTNYQRLTEIKAKYDPKNLFRMNANILPAINIAETKGAIIS